MRSSGPELALMRGIWLILTLSAGPGVLAVDIFVPADVPTISGAISIAVDGDQIIVSPGTWNEAIDLAGKEIVIRSQDGPVVTIISGTLDNPVVRINSGETELTVLDGFTIRGGGGILLNGVRKGGGIYINDASPRITNCIIEENQATVGAGIAIDGGNPSTLVLEQVVVRMNTALDSGGGLALTGSSTGISMTECTLEQNHANIVAGGLYCEASSIELQSCLILDNTSDLLGGGIWLYSQSEAVFQDCEIAGNTTVVTGGGLIVSDLSRVTLDHCLVRNNIGGTSGGGMLIDSGDSGETQVLRFCVFYGNSAMSSGANLGVSVNQVDIYLERCTFGPPAANSPLNITINNNNPEVVEINSCIVVGGSLQAIQAQPGSTVAFYSCIEGLANSGVTPIACIDEDPLFIDPAAGNLALGAGSGCIDSGNPALPADADGSPADMGALGPDGVGYFRRGDADASSTANLADAVQILAMLFIPGSDVVGCEDAADCNDDGTLNITDAVLLLDYLFVTGTPLPEPVSACGGDPTADSLDCSSACP